MITTGKTALFIISPENFCDEELNIPRKALTDAGVSVTIASTRRGVAIGMNGHAEQVDFTIEDITGENYDAIAIIGGVGAQIHLWEEEKLVEIVKRHHRLGRVVSSICLSGVVLAKAGILAGIKSTVYKNEVSLEKLRSYGAIYVNRSVVQEGNIITASGPSAAREFGQKLIRALNIG